MNQTKLVGVVIPIYNVEKYLRECLDSVVNQTYKNLQIILVNDGSTDENSLNIAKEYTLKDERFILFDKKNGGLSSARNVGIEYFSGEYKLKNITTQIKENSLIEFELDGNNHYEIHKVYKSYKAFNNENDLINFTYPNIDYIIFLDSDDYWELNCIEECVPRMDGVEIVWFDHYFYYDGIEKPDIITNSILELYNFKNKIIVSSVEWLLYTKHMKFNSFWLGQMCLIDFNYLKKIKLKFINYVIHEDHHFGLVLCFKSKYIYILNKKIYYYRVRANSIMNYNKISVYKLPNYLNLDLNNLKINIYKYISYAINGLYLIKYCNMKTYKKKILSEIFKNELENYILKPLMFNCYLYNLIYIKILYKTCSNIDKYFEFIARLLYISQNHTNLKIKSLNQIINNKNTQIQNQTNLIQEKDITIQNKNTQINQLTFQAKYSTAKSRIQSQLSYKLGQAMIINSKSILGYIRMPFVLSYIKDKYKQEQKIYQEKIKKDPSLILPPLQNYPDFQEALKEKQCLTYKLGQALIKANKTWYKGGYIKLWFEIRKLKKEFIKKK